MLLLALGLRLAEAENHHVLYQLVSGKPTSSEKADQHTA
ncbi:hypothetical protein GY50_0713 [Dehalococcoides mccartyi GY50]|nr:hypothetical protein GY50_0713 [Dehalococcoides mccartyi GY50]